LSELGKTCIWPQTGQTYVHNVRTGYSTGPDIEKNGGFSFQLLLEVSSLEQLEYYAHKDPAHQAALVKLVPILDKVVAFDMEV
jgi:hypothetical protein